MGGAAIFSMLETWEKYCYTAAEDLYHPHPTDDFLPCMLTPFNIYTMNEARSTMSHASYKIKSIQIKSELNFQKIKEGVVLCVLLTVQ